MDRVDSIKLAQSIRKSMLIMTNRGKSSHIASGLSIADILAVLYSRILRYDSDNPDWVKRDKFVLSKGHAGAAVYACLAEIGFIDPDELLSHTANGSKLSGHVSSIGVDGIEFSTGSLGHGLSVGCGFALSSRLGLIENKTVVLMGDGECAEGAIWEAALFASHNKLSNLYAIVDYNNLQSIKTVDETLNLQPFRDKWISFGWNAIEIDGHDHAQIRACFPHESFDPSKPSCIIARSIKGKGVSFMEDKVVWHYRWPRDEELELALKELGD